VVLATQGESAEAKAALEKLCRTYWWPLYGFVRREGYTPEEAQDLTQAFFARLLERKDLETVRQERGRLRSYLLASLKNFLSKARHRELNRQTRGRSAFGFAGGFARAGAHRPGTGPQIERRSHLRASLGINIIGASARAA
jgi:DNA-directed RNA polymerase specialized sigma24 family protein